MSKQLKLGFWMRLCIVLTAFWMVGGTLWQFGIAAHEASEAAQSSVELCEALEKKSWEECWQQREQTYDSYRPFQRAVLFSSIMALFAWILGGVFYFSGRWVMAGRKIDA